MEERTLKNMDRQTRQKALETLTTEELKDLAFELDMKDRWDSADYELKNDYNEELRKRD